MAKNLMVVESPTKSKTISQYLGKGFDILASMGHIRDLPKKKFGIDIEKNFKPHYVISPEKRKTVNKIVKKAKISDKIYLASDNDREGEAIAWHLKEILKKTVPENSIYRVVFNEITPKAIQESIKNPEYVDQKKVDAQQVRRILDRIVGYKISPILWKVIAKKLSAGRVQTVALRLICEREEEIKNFKPEEYWHIIAELKKDIQFNAKLTKLDGKKVKIPNETKANEIYEDIKDKKFIVKEIKQQKKSLSPLPPFITSTLQQEASKLIGFSTNKTMQIAQQLYEGVSIKGENKGLISYMRTDSVRTNPASNNEAAQFIEKQIGKDYLNPSRRIYKNKNKAQDAHEAIRPTSSFLIPDSVKSFLTKDQYKLYNLIWKRFIATQMAAAKIRNTKLLIQAGKALFETTGNIIDFDGFLKIYPYVSIRNKGYKLPELKEKDELQLLKLLKEQNFTKPPPRYTEATLVKKLESEGIGRPSTYAPIIFTLQKRKYVLIRRKKFYPTDLGMVVEKFLISKFANIFNVSFTAEMENNLDEIVTGQEDYLKALNKFYDSFEKQLKSVDPVKERKRLSEKTDKKCEKCGAPMIIKYSKYGKYLACSNFPKCRNTKSLDKNNNVTEKKIDEKCPKCGANLQLKVGKFGRFYACSNYPKCKYTKPFTIGLKCPLCGGELIERKNKKNITFYGCSNYPKCKFITNYKPVKIKCPDCGSGVMFKKPSKKGNQKFICLKCKKELIT